MDYNEIVELWNQGRENWFNYKFEVSKVGNLIFSYFEKRLGIQEKNENEKYLKKYPEKESKNEKLETTMYSASGCVEFKDNGWSSFCIRLLIEKDENTWPKSYYAFTICIKQKEDKWLVKLDPAKDDFVELQKLPVLDENQTVEEREKILFSDPGLEKLWESFIFAIKCLTVDNLSIWLNQEDKN